MHIIYCSIFFISKFIIINNTLNILILIHGITVQYLELNVVSSGRHRGSHQYGSGIRPDEDDTKLVMPRWQYMRLTRQARNDLF